MEKTKTDSRLELSEGCEEGETEVNPWVADHPLPLWWKLLVILTGPILLPVRLLLMLLIISFSYICARIALLGGGGRLETQPLRSWRKTLQSLVFFNIRCLSVAMGVLVRQRGRQAGREEAPLLVAAPHSTLLDWLVFPVTRSSVVAKQELSSWPVMGVIGRLLQTVWVDRDSQQARTETLDKIRTRCVDPGWPQLLIFPEGTNTNGQALVLFRSGAFSTGQPVQPVCVRSPNTVDTITWTWVQRYHTWTLLALTLASPYTRLDLEFLPVIQPSEDEAEDPRVYANKVRKTLGEHLNLPCSQMSYKDAKLCQQAAKEERKQKAGNREAKTLKYASNTSIDFVGNLTFGI